MRWSVMLLASLMLLSACSTSGSGNGFCAVAKPILVGDGDVFTDETARQVLAHNLTGRELCRW